MRLGLILLFVASFTGGTASAQTVRNVGIPVKLSDDAMNVFIEKQWQRQGWSRFTGTLLGCNYVIDLPSPTVTLTRGHGTLGFSVTVSSTNCGGPFQFRISPTIAISSGQISTAKVKLWLLDLKDWINDLPVPEWVRVVLRHELERRWGFPDLEDNIDAFPASLVRGVTTPFLDQRSVNFYYSNPFQFAWAVEDGFLVLTPSVNFQAGQGATVDPDFKTRLFMANDTDWLDIWSNIKAKVKTVRVFDLGTNQLYRVDPGVYTIKYHGDPANEWIMINLNGTRLIPGIFIVWVLYETDHTFYLRKYKVDSTFNGWTFATSERYN